MKISGVALPLQSKSLNTGDRKDEKTQNTKSKSEGQRYVTVRDGDYLYTYIVIGDNFKVLIGRLAVDKDKDEKTDEVKKQDNDKQTKEALDKLKFQSMPNQALVEYQQLQMMTLPKNDLHERKQATDESAVNF
ncbi:hypothetical protein [Pelosinus sp. sgz500959]|uniref:hypothetical protein n=1 Tax=Pelosinus sp. sgz500959 TaxID=3242472 RepID=UPI00366D51C9